MRARPATALVAALLLGALVLGACGGGDDAGEAATATTVASPLAALLGFSTDPADQETQQQRFIDQEREVQQQVAECMRAEGFEYTPQDPAAFMGTGPFNDDLPYDSREFAEKYGFGMSTTVEQDGGAFASATPPTDPNQAYVESLSETERAAYERALYGDMVDFDPSASSDTMVTMPAPSGCDGEARAETDTSSAFYTEFSDELEELYRAMENDPAIVAAQTEWSGCMAEEGYTYAGIDEMYQEASEKMNELYGMEVVTSAPPAGSESEDSTMATAMDGPPAIDEAKLAEAQAWERKVAVANWDCSRELYQVQSRISAELEQEFIDANRGRIDELLEQNR